MLQGTLDNLKANYRAAQESQKQGDELATMLPNWQVLTTHGPEYSRDKMDDWAKSAVNDVISHCTRQE